jgi:transcriptional regulator with XRE-family HTH domain
MHYQTLKDIIEQIQKGEGIDLTEIAKKAHIDRSYLSSFIHGKKKKAATAAYIGKISKQFPAYFDKQQKTTENNKLDEILSSLTELRGYTISILTGQSSGNEVIMGALDRLENNPVGSLSATADKLAIQFAERLHMIQTGKKVGARK